MKRLMSWIMVALMLISGMSVMAMPAVAAEGELINLYDPMTAVVGRAIEAMSSTNTNELIYMTSAPIEVKSGETLYFGPVNVSQGYQAYFYPKANTTSGIEVQAAQTPEVFKFDYSVRSTNADSGNTSKPNYVAVYSYTATADGYIRCTFPIEYADFYVITKDVLTYDKYYAYFDGKANANLWNQFLDVKYLIKPDGTIDDKNQNHSATHYIAVEPGDTITWGPHQDSMYYGAVGYDANKVGVTNEIKVGTSEEHPISEGVTKVATFTDADIPVGLKGNGKTYSIYSYKVPEDGSVSYVRVILYNSVPSYFQVQKNNVFDVKGYWELMGGDMESPYFGANSVWFGDSITQATQDLPVNGVWYGGWVGRVSKALNMNYDHNGESGWSLSTAREGRIVNRLIATQADEPAGGFDVVMLHGGTNDAWESVRVGEMTDSYYPGDFDIDTYAGALEELFYYATTLYGDTAEINYILNYDQPKKMSGQVYAMGPHYAEALKICEKWGVNAIDLFHDEVVRDVCALDTMKIYRDWCHATMHGYNVLSPFIVDKMLAATDGKAWVESKAEIADDVRESMVAGVAADEVFTAASKETFAATAAAAEGTISQKLNTVLAATCSLVQTADKKVSVHDMTKYLFCTKEFGVYNANDWLWLNRYNEQRGNSNGKTNFGNLPGYIDSDFTIYLMNDLSGSSLASLGIANPFKATFDGQGHSINGFVASSATNFGSTLFRYIEGATIRNLTLSGANCTGASWAGILVGAAKGTGNLIENVHIKNSYLTKTAGNGMGAILVQPNNTNAGSCTDEYTIRNCTVSGTTFTINNASETVANVGLIASRAITDAHVIENCFAYNNNIVNAGGANLTSTGGILGEAYGATVRNCGVYNNTYSNTGAGTIGSNISGVVGLVYAGQTANISNCYSDMADYALYNAKGTVVGANNFSVKDGTTTVAEITGNALAAKLNKVTDLHWAATPVSEELSLPMINEKLLKNHMIMLGDYALYTNATNGKLDVSDEDLAAVSGKIWRKGNTTLLTKDILKGVYEDAEDWYEVEYLLGDCIDTDTIDTADAAAILKALVNKPVEGYVAERADANGDGRVSVADVTRVLRYVLRNQNAG